MSLLNSLYPGAYALYSGASPGVGGRGGHAFLSGVMPPHLPLAMPADYGAAIGMGLALPSVGFPLLSPGHCGPGHPDSSSLLVCASKAAAAAMCQNHKSPGNGNNHNTNNNNNNNNNNRVSGHLTNFSIDEILGKKDDKSKTDVLPTEHCEAVRCVEGRDTSPLPQEESSEDTDPNARFSWLQCTRYRPPKLPRVKRKDGVKKRKLGRNPRVPFTQHQVNTLEQKFQRTHYLSSVDVAELSAALNLTETRVKIWFQNRRARERRDRENSLQGGSGAPGVGQGAGGGAGGGGQHSPSIHAGQRSSTGSTLSPGGSPIGRGLAGWPMPTPPTPSALAHFSHALHQHGSAFTPVSFSAY